MTECRCPFARAECPCMREFGDLATAIDALAARAVGGERTHDLARAMEDLLCDGYVACLQVDARISRLDRRRRELAALGDEGQRSDGRCELEQRRDCLERCAAETRGKLAALRERFVRIGGIQAALH